MFSCNPKPTGDALIDVERSHSFHLHCTRQFIQNFKQPADMLDVEARDYAKCPECVKTDSPNIMMYGDF